jgi:membrane-associated phospholipid phosphatase
MPWAVGSPDIYPVQGREAAPFPSLALQRAGSSALAFGLLCILVAFDATRALDWWGASTAAPLSSPRLDLASFLLSLVGEPHMTGTIALLLAIQGWRRHGGSGLTPLLLFIGVGLEVVLKYVLPHPGPPALFARELHLPAFLHFSDSLMLHFPTPYSFPSGHMLRATFLVALVSVHRPRWHAVGWLLILAMAFTRVYGNEHWLSDVVGGALLGWGLAQLALAGYKRGDAGPYGP